MPISEEAQTSQSPQSLDETNPAIATERTHAIAQPGSASRDPRRG